MGNKKIFYLIKMIQQNAVVLITAPQNDHQKAIFHMNEGAYDILNLPLKTELLIKTLERAQSHHRAILENMFIKNILFFGILMAPLWLLTFYLIAK